ncbi:MAG: 50S ribosomal protein L32 [Candidatus Aminicenantes bacterium]|nr:50S ribosomal protein L32 [Candidatus Aminicenantes bacterium]
MANPKRRHSRARRGRRRSHDFLTAPSLATCSHCGSTVLPHRVCRECGYYKGRQVIKAGEA